MDYVTWYVTEADQRTEKLLQSCFSNSCFTHYYLNSSGATHVEQVEDVAELLVKSHIQALEELPAEELSEGEVEALKLCRSAIRGEVPYVYAWNKVYNRNGESHGTVIAMCFKSEKPTLHALGKKILLELAEIQGNDEYLSFDT